MQTNKRDKEKNNEDIIQKPKELPFFSDYLNITVKENQI